MAIANAAVEPKLAELGCIYLPAEGTPLPYHFVGTSGAHLGGYVNLDPVFPHVRLLRDLGSLLAEPYIVKPGGKAKQRRIGAVVTPAIGSIPLSVVTAEVIMDQENRAEGDEVVAVWADKVEHEGQSVGFAFLRPGFVEALRKVAAAGDAILVVEDYINKMHSARGVVEAVRSVVGRDVIAGVATIAANQGVDAESLDVPHYTQLCQASYQTWSPQECTATGPCSKHVPIVVDEALGHGAKFRQANPDYPGGFTELRPA
jgi:orotate phosphoribosyltransferase